MEKELKEYISVPGLPSSAEAQQASHEETVQKAAPGVTKDAVLKNPKLCDDPGVKCDFFPVLTPGLPTLVACHDGSLGKHDRKCYVQNATTLCCAKIQSKNIHKYFKMVTIDPQNTK